MILELSVIGLFSGAAKLMDSHFNAKEAQEKAETDARYEREQAALKRIRAERRAAGVCISCGSAHHTYDDCPERHSSDLEF